MYNGIGLQTPRGSGTNGHIQTNKFFVKPKTGKVSETTTGFEADQGTAGITRKANWDILEHDRKRQMELNLVLLQDKLSDQGYTDSEITEKLHEARNALELEAAADFVESGGAVTSLAITDKKVSDTQTHQIAARKEKQMETLKAALGIGISEVDVRKKQDNSINLDDGEIEDDKPRSMGENVQNDGGKQQEKRRFLHVNQAKEPRSQREAVEHKKHGSRKRTHGNESSDTDSDKKHNKGSKKKYHGVSQHDSDSDIRKRPKSSKSKKRKTQDSDDSYTGSDDSGKEGAKKENKYSKAQKRRDSDDDSSSEGGVDSDDDSDTDNDKGKRNHVVKERIKLSRSRKLKTNDSNMVDKRKISDRKHDKKGISYGMVSDSDSDGARRQMKEKIDRSRGSRRHDTDEDDSDIASDEKIGKSWTGKTHDIIEDSRGRKRIRDEDNGESNSEEARIYKEDKRDSSHRRHGGDEDGSSVNADEKTTKGEISKRHDIGEERRGRKHSRDEEEDGYIKRGKEEEIQHGSRRQTRGEEHEREGRRHTRGEEDEREDRRHTKGEEDEQGSRRHSRGEDVERVGRRHTRGEEVEQEGRRHTKGEEAEREGRRYTKGEGDEQARRHAKGEGDGQGIIRHTRGEGDELASRRHSNVDVDEKESRKHTNVDVDEKAIRRHTGREKDEKASRSHTRGEGDEHGSRRHTRGEGDEQATRRNIRGKEDEKASRNHGRGEKDERTRRRHERDRHIDTSKRVRYDDDSRSVERRYKDEKGDE